MKIFNLFRRKSKEEPKQEESQEPIDLSLNAATTSHINGLYFMRTMSIIDGREVYAVKIGQSGDISKRMGMYRTHTPFTILGGIVEVPHRLTTQYEDACHIYLHHYALPNAYCCGEWEIVSKESYEILCKMCDTDDAFKEFVNMVIAL